MKEKIFGVLQRVGRAFMLPIAILPVAGLLLGIGSSFTNETMLKSHGLLDVMGPGTIPFSILSVMSACGDVIFTNLPLIFGIGVAIGMAKKEKEVAALSGAVAFFVMHTAIGIMLTLTGASKTMLPGTVAPVVGIESLQMGVFGGIIVGLGVAALHNRFYKIELPQMLAFFGGSRFVPIISALIFALVGVLMFFIWPPVQNAIYSVGDLVRVSGYAGTLLYGLMERALIPFGLHHVFYMPFWQTGVGGTAVIDGVTVAGAQNIFFAELASSNTVRFSVEATRFMAGKFPFMIFGLPGAALAMYRCAKPEHRKIAGGLLISAALTSIVTGITEPIEFTFLFVSPFLYILHCVLAGASYMFMHMLGVGVGMTFSGGAIDLTLFGILQGNDKTHWLNIIWVGILYAIVYYFLFSFLIKKFNLKTPGREDSNEETKLYTRADVNAAKADETHGQPGSKKVNEISVLITQGLGGKRNISDLDSCATRLRVTVNNPDLVDESRLKQSGAAGIIKRGNGVQVIYGPKVSVIKSELEDFFLSPESDFAIPENIRPEAAVAAGSEKKQQHTLSPQGSSCTIYAPLSGKVVPMSEVPDEVFATEVLGKGIAIVPDKGRVVAPADGVLAHISKTKHAFGFITKDKAELLIHVGIDTVKLNGTYYTVTASENTHMKKGDLIAEFDIDKITREGYSLITPVVVTNMNDFREMVPTKASVRKEGEVIMNLRQ